jgi:hypothetical protein
MYLRTLKNRIDAVAAKVSPALPPPCIVLDADNPSPADEERTRQACSAGAPVVRYHWGKEPTTKAVQS